MSRDTFKKRAWYNVIFLGCLTILALIIFSTGKEFLRVKKINQEINELQKEIIEIENKNLELSELLKYFDSDSFAEMKARTELGLKKPNERVVIIPQEDENTKISLRLGGGKENLPKSNFKRWWNYLFNRD